MIVFDNVTKMYDTNVGLENASIRINKGDFVFLVGPSGAGKSTFIKLILKEINADSGSIIVDGREVTKLSNREVPQLRRRIGIVWQDFRLLPKKTVFENVAFAMEILHKSRRQIRKKVPQVLSLVGIGDKSDKYPHELSAGEQQRVAIARAIINNPTVLIADEPTGNLDPDTATEIMDLLNQINITGTTILMVTHAKDIVDRMHKRVVAIDSGHIVRDEFGQYGFEESTLTEDSSDEEQESAEDASAEEAEASEVEEPETPESDKEPVEEDAKVPEEVAEVSEEEPEGTEPVEELTRQLSDLVHQFNLEHPTKVEEPVAEDETAENIEEADETAEDIEEADETAEEPENTEETADESADQPVAEGEEEVLTDVEQN